MKKVIYQSFVILMLVITSVSCGVQKQNNPNNNLMGTWQICDSNGVVDENLYGIKNETSYKIFSSERFSVFSIHLFDRRVIKSFLGSYSVDSQTITESVEYRSNGYPNISNQKYTYKYKIENDLL